MASVAAYLTTPDGRRPRVAVVDGNHATAMITILLVEQFGCAPVPAPSGEAALALIRGGEAVDLVLIDLDIPDMDGIVAATLIRAMGERGAMPIVPLAHARGEVTGPRGRAAGFTGAVLKPYSPRELHAAMQTALTRSPTLVRTEA
jgi:two-component system chemotaxis response regulator CheY